MKKDHANIVMNDINRKRGEKLVDVTGNGCVFSTRNLLSDKRKA
ncbi:MAG: hypothetical protein V2I37_02625 [Marinilabiliaceae bacterium]|nr:hypothetical protein [Marinilabiliaceae bacterium]